MSDQIGVQVLGGARNGTIGAPGHGARAEDSREAVDEVMQKVGLVVGVSLRNLQRDLEQAVEVCAGRVHRNLLGGKEFVARALLGHEVGGERVDEVSDRGWGLAL